MGQETVLQGDLLRRAGPIPASRIVGLIRHNNAAPRPAGSQRHVICRVQRMNALVSDSPSEVERKSAT